MQHHFYNIYSPLPPNKTNKFYSKPAVEKISPRFELPISDSKLLISDVGDRVLH